MSAVTRWVQYSTSEVGSFGDGRSAGCKGSRGYSIGTTSVGDNFTIGTSTNRLYISIDGDTSVSGFISLTTGSGLDPRFVARDITDKLRYVARSEKSLDQKWLNATCYYTNSPYGNCFKIYSGSLGASSAVTISSGTNSAHTILGYTTKSETGGSTNNSRGSSNNFSGTVSVSGTYYGLFDDMYKIVVTNDHEATRGIGTVTKNITYDGTMTTGGVFNYTSDISYTLTISIANGTVMGQGTGNVPTMSWTSTVENSTTSTELLYPNTWYNVGTKGLRVKFTDAVFAAGTWTIPCYAPDYSDGSNVSGAPGTAYYAYSSLRGDMGAARVSTVSGTYQALGNKGLFIKFNPTSENDYLAAGDEFYVMCAGVYPGDPANYGITSINYGNVTVSTDSDVKCVLFEIMSGAIQASTIKFGLQSHGTFSHHNANNSDTYFRFGTVGPANTGVYSTFSGIEWWSGITSTDISYDTPPTYLYATDDNLSVVSTADASKSIGNVGLTSDLIFVGIHLGNSEVGSNSSITNRLYFDYN